MLTGSGQDTFEVEDSRFPLSQLGLYRLMYGNDCHLYVVARDASEAFQVAAPVTKPDSEAGNGASIKLIARCEPSKGGLVNFLMLGSFRQRVMELESELSRLRHLEGVVERVKALHEQNKKRDKDRLVELCRVTKSPINVSATREGRIKIQNETHYVIMDSFDDAAYDLLECLKRKEKRP